MSLPSLYELRTEYQKLAQKLSESDLDPQTIADTIESTGILDTLAEKGQGYVMVARTFEAYEAAIDTEIARLTARKKHVQSVPKRLYELLLVNMQAAGINRIEGPLMTISIRNNPESVQVFEEGLIPEAYMTKPEAPAPAPDKTAIKTALKAGTDVPGCKMHRTVKLHIA